MNNFITDIINKGKNKNKLITRFPPEPNGYLHIGHAKSIIINFSIAEIYNGKCNLRFDDTNPLKENIEYVNAIIEDVNWLGYNLDTKPLYASDYFEQMYQYAIQLIKQGDVYVDDQSSDEIKINRGTLQLAGKDSPYRHRSKEENLNLFLEMKDGKYQNGEKVLRAKIDMSSSNLNLRDPIIYRILHVKHHRTGNQWCIYPMYDWAHGIEDAIEKVTYSICTLEFEDHRPLYDWFLKKLKIFHPQQIEFARLNLSYTLMSKRYLKLLVDKQFVNGWDDPRMPTISGLRRRGYTADAIKLFIDKTGVAKRNGVSDIALLEHSLRENLNKISKRVMVVQDPIKVVITNFPDDKVVELDAVNNPENENDGKRKILFSKELYIEHSDFSEDPPKKFFRLSKGKEVRLLHAYYILCNDIVKDKSDKIIQINCTYDPASKGGWSKDGRKVKGTIHWVSKPHAVDVQINIYDRLFNKENLGDNYLDFINSESLKIIKDAKAEPSIKDADINLHYQFLRNGYFKLDKLSSKEKIIFNRSVSLRDTWSKKQ